MVRIYEVHTETTEAENYSSYRVAAKTFKEAVDMVIKKELTPPVGGERISEVHILASESR